MDGTDKLRKQLYNLKGNQPKAAATALMKEAEQRMTGAKKRTPVEFGDLRASGHVEGPIVTKDTISVRLVFGGPAAPYAIYVHEILTNFHHVGEAKFLEREITQNQSGMADRIADTYQKELLRGL